MKVLETRQLDYCYGTRTTKPRRTLGTGAHRAVHQVLENGRIFADGHSLSRLNKSILTSGVVEFSSATGIAPSTKALGGSDRVSFNTIPICKNSRTADSRLEAALIGADRR